MINFKQLERTQWECFHNTEQKLQHPLHYNILSSVFRIIFFSKCPIFTEENTKANGEYIQENIQANNQTKPSNTRLSICHIKVYDIHWGKLQALRKKNLREKSQLDFVLYVCVNKSFTFFKFFSFSENKLLHVCTYSTSMCVLKI